MSALPFPSQPLLSLLILVVLASVMAQILRLPYTLALMFMGLFASLFLHVSLPQVSPETFLTLLLPPLVFHAATHLKISEMSRDAFTIFGFAFLGTLLSAFLIGISLDIILGVSLLEGLLLGSIISPTDPIAVISTLQRLGVNKRLTLIIDGESLFNDGVAVVMYLAIITALLTGIFDLGNVLTGIISSISIGILVGGVIGYLIVRIIGGLERTTKGIDLFVLVILTFITMYGSYQATIYAGGSGIIAVAIAGIIIGNMMPRSVSDRNLENLDVVWEFLAFLVTSVAFMLIGVEVEISLLVAFILPIALSIIIVLASRATAVYGISQIINLRKRSLPRSWQNIVIWSGLRGPVSIMMAIGIKALPILKAEEIIAVTFGVVIFSILFQGLSIRFLVRKLHVE